MSDLDMSVPCPNCQALVSVHVDQDEVRESLKQSVRTLAAVLMTLDKPIELSGSLLIEMSTIPDIQSRASDDGDGMILWIDKGD